MRFIDSHLHLADYPSPDGPVGFARGAGGLLVSCGTDKASSEETLRLARTSGGVVRAFVGVHPSEAEGETEWVRATLRVASGLGEVGMDPKYSEVGRRSRQLSVLEAQLEAAQELRKPVEVHSRGAENECLDVLEGFRLHGVLLHWFASEELLGEAARRGYFEIGRAHV